MMREPKKHTFYDKMQIFLLLRQVVYMAEKFKISNLKNFKVLGKTTNYIQDKHADLIE
jgi:hypothetical protein